MVVCHSMVCVHWACGHGWAGNSQLIITCTFFKWVKQIRVDYYRLLGKWTIIENRLYLTLYFRGVIISVMVIILVVISPCVERLLFHCVLRELIT